jgi:hypothetical protein
LTAGKDERNEEIPMKSCKTHVAALAACLCGLAGAAIADEEMDRIIATAAPFMHHSCESVLIEYESDPEQVNEIVRLMAMISLYNRQIDVVATVPDEYLDDLKDEFVEELEDACDNDGGKLLAGAVDDAVKETIEEFE